MLRRDFCAQLLPVAAVGALEGATLPRPAPDLAIEMPHGRPPLKLSTFKGKVIAVEFVLTYCSHCQRASRVTELLYREYGSKGFQPVAAAIDPTGDPVAYARDHNLSFPVGRIKQEQCMEFLQHPMMLRLLMPQIAFIDRNFMIVAQYGGDSPFFGDNEEKNMREQVEKLLKPAATPARKTTSKKKS